MLILLLHLIATPALSQTAEWIWHNENGAKPAADDVRHFRMSFQIGSGIIKAELNVACDGQATVWVNGKEAGSSNSWKEPLQLIVTDKLTAWSENVIAVRAKSTGTKPTMVAALMIDEEYGKRKVVISDRQWVSSTELKSGWDRPGFDSRDWTNVVLVAKLGAKPWGNVFLADPAAATPASEVTVPPGFKVELLRSALPREGSWISMAIDDKGRLYISPQGAIPESGFANKNTWGGLWRVTLDEHGQIAKWEKIPVPVGDSMGMLWAFNSLYVSGQGPDGQAIYRLRDTDGDDTLDQAELFKKVPGGGGEHGAHAIILGRDNKLYIAHGNSTPLVAGIAADSPHQRWQEDFLLPRIKDPVATFFDKLKIPYGQILRTDENGSRWEFLSGGFRNQYDIDFNEDGELFTFDSDMEWDVGLPWYRPTRILHITSGSEFGFREGSTKWPDYYPDSLPAVANIGLSSPTGVKFGTKSKFPEKYRRAFYAMDWTFGRIIAVHLKPKGASYEGTTEDFLKGKGMPMTDLEFGKDGAMYFSVGGRGTQSGLYRVSYVGKPESFSAPKSNSAALKLRRQLETFHGREDSKAIATAWPHLDNDDHFIRYAARVAIESQPIAQWRDRTLAEKKPRAALTALLALARCRTQEDQEPLLKALAKFPLDSLDDEWKLNKLRVIEMSFMRQGQPSEEMRKTALEKLGKQYPAKSYPLNRELSQLLVWLEAPDVVEKTLALLAATDKHDEQIWYAYVLREAKGWTPAQRATYFSWFNKARGYRGGNSFSKFIVRIREEALKKLTDNERAEIAALTDKPSSPVVPAAPARAFVREWKLDDLTPLLSSVNASRNLKRGKEAFAAAQCLACHKFGNDGGSVGPDLTGISGRFNRRDILESTIDPSKVISDQYRSLIVKTKDDTLSGLVAEETADNLVLITEPIAQTKTMISKKDITTREPSKISIMPTGLLNTITQDEILDLLAYIESAGQPSLTPKK